MTSLQKTNKIHSFALAEGWTFWVPVALILMYALVLIAAIIAPFFQKEFFNPTMLIPLYSLIAVSEFIFTFFIWNWESWKNKKIVYWALFVINILFITIFLTTTGWRHSVFFLLFLVNIIGAGLVLQSEGSFWVAILSSLGFNLSILLGPETKSLNFLFFLALNNISFFIVSGISGMLSDELYSLGIRLTKTTEDLTTLKNIHEVVLKNITSSIILIDAQNKIHHFNTNLSDVIADEEFIAALKSNHQIDIEKEVRFYKGAKEFRYYRVKESGLKLLTKDGDSEKNLGRLFVIDDITEIKNYEWNLREQEKLAAVGKLAAGIAHEIRNPLASISGSVQLLSQQASNADDQKLFNIVIKETDRLNLLISDFLNYAKPLPKPTDITHLSNLINDNLELIKHNKKLIQNVEVIKDIQDDLKIYGFRDKLTQSILNIIINSYQAMAQSLQPQLTISLTEHNEDIVLKIKDNGSGMNDEVKKRLFEPFFTTKSQGTGLGLAVTHKIFEAHNASLMVESEVGKGTEFVIKFPKSVRVI